MPCKYTLEWFDAAVAMQLRLAKDGLLADDEVLNTLLAETESEAAKLRSVIRQEVFGLHKEQKVEALLRQYHAALIALHDSLERTVNGKNCPLQAALGGVLAFIERSYSRYLNLDEYVPVNYITTTEAEVRMQLEAIGPILATQAGDAKLISIITGAVVSFDTSHPGHHFMTFRELLYRKELVHELALLSTAAEGSFTKDSVHELLMYMNFNSKDYVSYYTTQFAARLGALRHYDEKVDLLLLGMKTCNQAPRREGARLSSHDADLKTAIGGWFAQELDYLEHKRQLSATAPASTETLQGMKQGAVQKLLCSLSVDQIALLLRSADELKILVSRSMNAIFKAVAPHLSTSCRESISPDSMRSKAYVAETRDKEIVIAKLREMIEKIREY